MNTPPLKPHSKLTVLVTHEGLSAHANLDSDILMSPAGPDYLEVSFEELLWKIATALRESAKCSTVEQPHDPNTLRLYLEGKHRAGIAPNP